MPDFLKNIIGGVATTATDAASAAAQQQAQATYEQFKPLIWAGAFMVVTVFIFFFLPRFVLPWRKVS